MALVGDDQVEGVDRDVELVRVVVDRFVTSPEDRLPAEEVDGHPLDRADVDERVPGLRIGEVPLGQDLGVELLVFAEVLLLERRRVDLVDLVELQPRLRLERGEGADGLRREGSAIDQEEDAPGDARLHEPVDLVHDRERLAGAGRHRDEQVPLALRDGLLDGGVGLALVRPQAVAVVGHRAQPRAVGVDVALEHLAKGARRVEGRDAARAVQRVANVVEPDDLAVGRVQERAAQAGEVVGAPVDAAGVPLGLGEDVLGPHGHLLRLDDADDVLVEPERVVGWAVRRLFLLGPARLTAVQTPPDGIELRIDAPFAGLPLALAGHFGPVSRLRRRSRADQGRGWVP